MDSLHCDEEAVALTGRSVITQRIFAPVGYNIGATCYFFTLFTLGSPDNPFITHINS